MSFPVTDRLLRAIFKAQKPLPHFRLPFFFRASLPSPPSLLLLSQAALAFSPPAPSFFLLPFPSFFSSSSFSPCSVREPLEGSPSSSFGLLPGNFSASATSSLQNL